MEKNIYVSNKIENILRDLDLDILTARSGEQGISIVKSTAPHLILLDLALEKMNGFDFITFLKSNGEYGFIPHIILTSHGDIEEQERALELGADDFLTEPTSPEELIPRVRKHIH